MVIRGDKLYPYPVLADFLDDYKDKKAFDVKMICKYEGYELRVEISATLMDEDMKKLIRAGKAVYTYHVECNQTGFRKVYETDKESMIIPLPQSLIRGRTQVCAFITAKKDLHGWYNPSFNDDYGGMSFDIDAGSILAINSEQLDITVNNKLEDLADVPSIFSIIRNEDAKARAIKVDESGDKILVILPFNEYSKFTNLNKNEKLQPVLYSMTLVPALVYVLGVIKTANQNQRVDYEASCSWYRSIKRNLKENFDINLDNQKDVDKLNSVQMAQELINVPFNDAIEVLSEPDEEGGHE